MPSMSKPAAGDTDWTTEINDNWTALQNQLVNAFQGRLQRNSDSILSLQRYGGDVVEVNGSNVSLGVSGIEFDKVNDNLITSTGADSGSKTAASTLYYVYVSNASASPFPSDLRLSSTAPSLLNGVKYLDTSGNGANWRFVGWVQMNASNNFVDSETQRFVVNFYNRRHLSLVSPAETTDSWTYTTDAWRQANNNSNNKAEFIANGEDAVHVQVTGRALTTNNILYGVGVGIDSTSVDSSKMRAGMNESSTIHGMPTAIYVDIPSEGYHAANWLERSVASGTVTWYGDQGNPTFVRTGITGWVMG